MGKLTVAERTRQHAHEVLESWPLPVGFIVGPLILVLTTLILRWTLRFAFPRNLSETMATRNFTRTYDCEVAGKPVDIHGATNLFCGPTFGPGLFRPIGSASELHNCSGSPGCGLTLGGRGCPFHSPGVTLRTLLGPGVNHT
jgi:hypothetical protein